MRLIHFGDHQHTGGAGAMGPRAGGGPDDRRAPDWRDPEGRASDQRRAALGFAWCYSAAAWLELAKAALIIVRSPALRAFCGQHLIISGW